MLWNSTLGASPWEQRGGCSLWSARFLAAGGASSTWGSVLRTNLVLLAHTTQIVVCDIDSRAIPRNVLGRLVTTVNTPPPTQPGLSELLHSYKVR